ncbi:uncharacterized protein LOC135130575 [Zophobas morio]|uniref:uncharacterized protein LOC135130575 n=1 Tax=Zophobas morio TaxID=2755281 RepID=UPI003083D98F
MTNTIKECFSLTIITLRFVGLYPDNNEPLVRKIWAYTLYFLEVLLTILTLVNLILEDNLDTMVMNQMVIFLTETGSSCFKLLPFLINGHEIKHCINYFGHRRFAPKHPQAKKIMDDCIRVCKRNIRIFFGVVGVAAFFFNTFPLIREKYTLQVNIWVPYELSRDIVFIPTYICVLIVSLHIVFVGEMIGPLIGRNMLTMCFSCIGLTLVSFTNTDAIIYVMAYGILSFEIFFYCHYGTLLFEEVNNETLIQDVCLASWYKYDTKIRKILLIIMERSKTPLVLSAGKVVDLTYRTFMTVLKTSYSLIAVMNNY